MLVVDRVSSTSIKIRFRVNSQNHYHTVVNGALSGNVTNIIYKQIHQYIQYSIFNKIYNIQSNCVLCFPLIFIGNCL